MRINNLNLTTFLLVVLTTGVLFSCKKQLTETSLPGKSANQVVPVLTEATSVPVHPARGVAANCFQCHGTNGYAGELKIAGMGYSELVSKLNSFRIRDPRSDIMNFHALAYTADEINAIADYFSQQ